MKVKIIKAEKNDVIEMEKIHLQNFQEIGEREGFISKYVDRPENFSLVAVDENNEIVGYLISVTHNERSWLEWFGVSTSGSGIAQMLLDKYFEEMKSLNVIESILISRNRFKKAISFYLKNDYDIKGLSLGNDNELMITMRKKI